MRAAGLLSIVLVLIGASLCASASEHFERGEFRAGVSWDSISAMDSGVLRFGANAGIHVLNGVEIGYEQQFIVPPDSGSQSRSFGFLRLVPFRKWAINPFLAARAGLFFLRDQSVPAVGAGCGAVLFVDRHFAFEASLFHQGIFHLQGPAESQTEFDWRLVVYF